MSEVKILTPHGALEIHIVKGFLKEIPGGTSEIHNLNEDSEGNLSGGEGEAASQLARQSQPASQPQHDEF